MKRLFEGKIYPGGPDEWPEGRAVDDSFGPATLELLRHGNKGEFALVVHPEYLCYEYPIKLDLLSFSRLHLRVPVRVIGLPVSVDRPGWRGSFEALCDDYRRRKGLICCAESGGALRGRPNSRGANVGQLCVRAALRLL